jgi:hypothetical protein
VLAFLVTLFLTPATHEIPTPGPVRIDMPGAKHWHLRWKSLRGGGNWTPPNVQLPLAGTHWVSAATRSVVRTYSAGEFNQLVASQGLTVVEEYRKKYKQAGKPGRVVTSEYGKTMITVGPPEPIQPVEMNLPLEFILRYPQLVQLNFRGQPIPDVLVLLNGKPLGRTNGAGQLPLPVLNTTARLAATVARVYPDASTAPWEFFHTTLTLPPLSQRQAAIHHRQLAGDEAGRRQVVHHRISDFVPGPEAAGGGTGLEGLQGRRAGFLEGNGAGGHAVDTDVRGPSSRHGPRHVDYSGLRGAVMHEVRPGLNAAD